MKHQPKRFLSVALLPVFFCSLLFTSCNRDYSAKPKAYPRVVYPERKYELFDPPNCPFRFQKPVYARVDYDTTYLGKKTDERCWLNISFPDFNGNINFTYKDITDTINLERLLEDAHKLSYKHTKKADYIDEIKIENEHGIGGVLYDIGGDAASNIQFFLTDTTSHYVRGALYFYNPPNTDSMAPVVSFVKEDLKQMLKTFEWK